MVLLYCFTSTLCLALSTGSFPYPQPILPLQIKNVTSNFRKGGDLFTRADWIQINGTLVTAYNRNASLALLDTSSDSVLGIRGNQHALRGWVYSNETLGIPKSKACITATLCQRGQRGFCNPYSVDRVQNEGQIVSGSYVKLLPCVTNHISNRLSEYKHRCDMSLLGNGECNEECDFEVFDFDRGDCPPAPSASPSLTLPTNSPSSSPIPSSWPSAAPSIWPNPSTAPSVVPSQNPATNGPSDTPTTLDTLTPLGLTAAPTIPPTVITTSLEFSTPSPSEDPNPPSSSPNNSLYWLFAFPVGLAVIYGLYRYQYK